MNARVVAELVLGFALALTVVGIVLVVIVSGASSLPATGLPELALALGGGLLGAKVPGRSSS